MRGGAHWLAGGIVSLALHAGLAAVVLTLWPPHPMPQPRPEPSVLTLATLDVPGGRARVQTPEAPAAASGDPAEAQSVSLAVPHIRAPGAAAPATAARPTAQPGSRLDAVATDPAHAAIAAVPLRATAAAVSAAAAQRAPAAPRPASPAALDPSPAAASAPPMSNLAHIAPAAPQASASASPVASASARPRPPASKIGPALEPAAARAAPRVAPARVVGAPSLAPIATPSAAPATGPGIAAARPEAPEGISLALAAALAPDKPPDDRPLAPATAGASAAGAAILPAGPARADRAEAPPAGTALPAPHRLARATLPSAKASPMPAPGRHSPSAAPRSDAAAEGATAPDPARRAAPPETVLTAAFDWSGAGLLDLDAAGLGAVQAFLAPDRVGEERDRIAKLLQSPDCARLFTLFDPETGALELRGHVPDAAARAGILAAFRQEIGASLPVADALRVLPAPQCSVLGTIDALGLPQSEEQLSDVQMIGARGYARAYAFTEGAALRIDLTSPDYPSYIYVDYYDGAGQVLHLSPNRFQPLAYLPAATAFSLPDPANPASPRFQIGPPYGQDIAVTLAASVAIYDAPRPLVEPAAAYLEFLQTRLAAARAAPGFRGEWAYLLVSTGSR